MADFFRIFVQRIGPLVITWDYIYNLMTIKDSRETITFVAIMTYILIYQETFVMLMPLYPIIVILFIFYTYYYEIKFKRPQANYHRNIRLIQSIMQVTVDIFEV